MIKVIRRAAFGYEPTREADGGIRKKLTEGVSRAMTDLLLRQVAESRPGCEEGSPDDYDVIGPGGLIIGRIFKAITSPPGTPWMWTLAYGQDEDRSSTHGYEATREAATQAFARSWQEKKEGPLA